MNIFTVLAMVHHDSNLSYHGRIGMDRDVERKIQHHYISIDYDLTNTTG